MVLRQRERARRIIRLLLVAGSVAMFGLLIAAAILLEATESCRFPRSQLVEEFTYEIDTSRTSMEYIYTSGKRNTIRGGRIKNIFLSQAFGTYTVRADPEALLSEVRFEVSNRARDKYFLPRMTEFRAERILETRTVDGVNFTEPLFNVFLLSNTSNSLYGSHSCKRADVTIIVPSACLLDETRLDIAVAKGHIKTEGDVSGANFDTITLKNDVGDITAHNLQALRVNLNTSEGTLDAKNVSAHFLFLLTRSDGGLIKAEDVKLFSADDKDSCRVVTTYKEGFPRIEKYARNTVECDQELGKLTVDSRGAENGGRPAVSLSRVAGGNIEQKIRLGHTAIRLKACYDFYGYFNISSPFGRKTVNTLLKPLTVLEQIEEQDERLVFDVNSTSTGTPLWLELLQRTSEWTYGRIHCPVNLLPSDERLFQLNVQTEVTGDITLDVIEPRLGWDGT
mmetsp:Transcript_34806/g.82565  ORF Transcript_34806/g.82565 Transcript_34806/m.82565 type:complete len:451 (-) Transcript_34806:2851-4203(-)